MGLWKTTIVIWSEYDGHSVELSTLARDAETGDSYLTYSESTHVENPLSLPPDDFPEGAAEFFNLARFTNYYKCPIDNTSWSMEWSAMCNDRCPHCNREIEPHQSEES